MKKFLSTAYTETSFNIALLLLRLTFGLLICILHGFTKMTHFSQQQAVFFDPFHIGHRWSLILSIFAEVFCAILVTLGLFTRLAALVLVINMGVAAFMVHKGMALDQHEMAFVYLIPFFSILLVGPGRYSVDGAMGK